MSTESTKSDPTYTFGPGVRVEGTRSRVKTDLVGLMCELDDDLFDLGYELEIVGLNKMRVHYFEKVYEITITRVLGR